MRELLLIASLFFLFSSQANFFRFCFYIYLQLFVLVLEVVQEDTIDVEL